VFSWEFLEECKSRLTVAFSGPGCGATLGEFRSVDVQARAFEWRTLKMAIKEDFPVPFAKCMKIYDFNLDG
jgi:hypothetical protein